MRKSLNKTLWPLLAASCLYGCGQNGNATNGSTSAGAEPQAAAGGNPDKCVDGNAMNVGDTDVTLTLAGTDFHWDTTTEVVTLTRDGDGKDVELVESKTVGGPSLPKGDCLRSGGYIRLASTRLKQHPEPNRYLQALLYGGVDQPPHPNPNVTIGNYPDDSQHIDAIFNVVKIPDATGKSPGAIIRKGDTIIIRGVSHDPWLKAPENPTQGAMLGLIDWNQDANASRWVISKGK